MNNRRIFGALIAAIVLATLIASCADNPVTPIEEHFEARGVALRMNGIDTVLVDSNRIMHGKIVVQQGTLSPHITLQFIKESDGSRGLPAATDTDMKLGWTIADTTIAQLEREDDDGEWALHIQGKTVGQTTIVIRLLHVDHSDFQSIPIPIEVIP